MLGQGLALVVVAPGVWVGEARTTRSDVDVFPKAALIKVGMSESSSHSASGDDAGADTSGEGSSIRGVDTDTGESVSGDSSSSSSGSNSTGSVATPPPKRRKDEQERGAENSVQRRSWQGVAMAHTLPTRCV